MDYLELHAAAYWRLGEPLLEHASMDARVAWLGTLVGQQLRQCIDNSGCVPEQVNLSGTMFPSSLSDTPALLAIFHDALARSGAPRPTSISTAYQCAGWGYVLRFFMKHTPVRRLAIVIADVNLHNLEAARSHPAIGASGFGVTSLLFRLPPQPSSAPACSGPHPHSAFNQMIGALRAREAAAPGVPTFIPFLRTELAQAAERSLPLASLGANRNGELGHCFGSDVWIGIISSAALRRDAPVVAAAVGYQGYCTVADVLVRADAWLDFRDAAPG